MRAATHRLAPVAPAAQAAHAFPCQWLRSSTCHRHLEHHEGCLCHLGVLPTHPYAASNPTWAAEDIKSARRNITLYGLGRFGKNATEVAAAKLDAEAAERATGRDGAPAR